MARPSLLSDELRERIRSIRWAFSLPLGPLSGDARAYRTWLSFLLVPRSKRPRAQSFAVLIAVGAVVALSLAACSSSDPPPTAEQIVEVWFAEPGQKLQFCKDYARGPELALKRFEEDSEELEGYPSAHEIFDEAATRC